MDIKILVDTREKKNIHITQKLDSLNIPYTLKKLSFGDYSFELDGVSFENRIVIERKSGIDEITGNFSKGRSRFIREFERAYMKKTKVYLMIEDSSWEQIEKGDYRSRFSPKDLKNFLNTWCNTYQLKLDFVDKSNVCDFMIGMFKKYIQEVNV